MGVTDKVLSKRIMKTVLLSGASFVLVLSLQGRPFAQELDPVQGEEETSSPSSETTEAVQETPEAASDGEVSQVSDVAQGSPEAEAPGKAIYEKRCAHCHGIRGGGDGPAAAFFKPPPANFKRAEYKYASTQKGELPTDEDLFKTVTFGLPGTGMPAWEKVLNEADRSAVVAYIKTFSKKFAREKSPPKKIEFGAKIASSAESIAKGKELFFKVECNRCHGVEGRADGSNASELKVWPRNLTKGWIFRRTNAPEEIFQRITRGIIVMPSFAQGQNVETTEEERWHIANYVNSLSSHQGRPLATGATPPLQETIIAKKVDGELTENPDDPIWSEMKSYYFPLVGQVTIEPRMFTPTIDAVFVKAIFNDKEFALQLSWDDPTRSKVSDGAEGDDAMAVQFPSEIREGERPYFIMGDKDYPVYVARYDAAAESIEERIAHGQESGVGIRFTPQDKQHFKGNLVYKNGQYRVVLKRALNTGDAGDPSFAPMQFIPVAFSAWNGSNGEIDSLRSISAWYYLLLKLPEPPQRYIYPTIFALLVIGIELWISRRYGKGKKT